MVLTVEAWPLDLIQSRVLMSVAEWTRYAVKPSAVGPLPSHFSDLGSGPRKHELEVVGCWCESGK